MKILRFRTWHGSSLIIPFYNSTKQRGWHLQGWGVHQLTFTSLKSHIIYNLLLKIVSTKPPWLEDISNCKASPAKGGLEFVWPPVEPGWNNQKHMNDSPRSKSIEMILKRQSRGRNWENFSTSEPNKLKSKYNLEEPVWQNAWNSHKLHILSSSCFQHKTVGLLLRLLKATTWQGSTWRSPG